MLCLDFLDFVQSKLSDLKIQDHGSFKSPKTQLEPLTEQNGNQQHIEVEEHATVVTAGKENRPPAPATQPDIWDHSYAATHGKPKMQSAEEQICECDQYIERVINDMNQREVIDDISLTQLYEDVLNMEDECLQRNIPTYVID